MQDPLQDGTVPTNVFILIINYLLKQQPDISLSAVALQNQDT